MKSVKLLLIVIGLICLVILMNQPSTAKADEFGFSFRNERYVPEPVVPRLYFYYDTAPPLPYYGRPPYYRPPYISPYPRYYTPPHYHPYPHRHYPHGYEHRGHGHGHGRDRDNHGHGGRGGGGRY